METKQLQYFIKCSELELFSQVRNKQIAKQNKVEMVKVAKDHRLNADGLFLCKIDFTMNCN